MPKIKKVKLTRKKRLSKELIRKNNVVVKKPTSKSCWRPVSGYEGFYEVSSLGKIRSVERDVPYPEGRSSRKLASKIIRPSSDKDGYLGVSLYKNGISRTYKVHRLVASAFIPNPENFPDVNHKNEIKDDNRVENLEWCTREYNVNYGDRNKKASEVLTRYVYQRFTVDGKYIDTLKYQDIVNEGFDYGLVAKASTGEFRTAYGLIWKRLSISEFKPHVTPVLRRNGVVVNKPTSKVSWKSFEALVAKFFSTRRVPLSGSNSGHGTNSDSLHDKLYIECKVRQKISLWQLFTDTEEKAKVEKKFPVVAIKQKGGKGYLLVLRPEDLQEIAKIQREGIAEPE